MTEQKTPISKSFRYLLNLDIASHTLHVVWICPGNGSVPITKQAYNRRNDDKDKACNLVSSGHNENKLKTGWEMHCILGEH